MTPNTKNTTRWIAQFQKLVFVPSRNTVVNVWKTIKPANQSFLCNSEQEARDLLLIFFPEADPKTTRVTPFASEEKITNP